MAKPDQIVIHMDQLDLKPKPKPETVSNNKERALTCQNTFNHRLNFSKPKSRFTESSYTPPLKRDDAYAPITFFQHSSVCLSSSGSDDDDDEDEDTVFDEIKLVKGRKKKIKWGVLTEWVVFFVILTAFICSVTVENLKNRKQYGIHIWRWFLMMMVIISGRLVSGWLVNVIVFSIERNFMLREKVLYFVYGLRRSFQNQLWLGLVLIAWNTMFTHNEVAKHHKLLKILFNLLITTLSGTTIWLFKILAVKFLASSFHVTTFFDRLKESVFHHYILETLAARPLLASDTESVGTRTRRTYNQDKLRKLSTESNASVWNFKRLVRYIMSSGLSKTVDDFGKAQFELKTEREARNCAQRIFRNVAKPNAKYIDQDDLLVRFLKKEEVETIFPYFDGAVESGRIRRSAFRDWVIRAYRERKSLAHSLNDTKTAVKQLHKLAGAIVLVFILVVFLLVMELATSKVLLVVSSQLLLVGFMFQNTCKCIFESIIFVFIMHPFDVGDRCVINNTQMVVEEMNILTTVFIGDNNEKVFYPNSVLSTKPISNFYRSPEMGDSVDFTIDFSTSQETIAALKMHIKQYIESKPKYWNPDHGVIVTEIENMDKLKMSLGVLHTMNHQDYGEKTNRKSELVFELKRIFEMLGIKYRVLPQEVHFSGVNPKTFGKLE